MSVYPYDDAFRLRMAGLCAAFERLGPGEGASGLKPAAVAIALIEAQDGEAQDGEAQDGEAQDGEAQDGLGEAAFLLTRRAEGLRAHGGQWALPGGRCDAGETVQRAALRELREEVGLTLDADAVLGTLDDYPTRSGYLVTPVVVWVGAGGTLAVNAEEVASVHRIALAEIARADAVGFTTIPQSERRVVHVQIDGSLVYAPTAAFLYQFRELLAGRTTRVADLEQPVFAWR